jgi:hypothetical protein
MDRSLAVCHCLWRMSHEVSSLSWFDRHKPVGGHGRLVTLHTRLALSDLWRGDRFGDQCQSKRTPRTGETSGRRSSSIWHFATSC